MQKYINKVLERLDNYWGKFNQLNSKGKLLVIVIAAVILYALLRLV